MSSRVIIAEIFLKNGTNVFIPWRDADEYIKNNLDQIGYRSIKTNRFRSKK